jgi:hypothetical protein
LQATSKSEFFKIDFNMLLEQNFVILLNSNTPELEFEGLHEDVPFKFLIYITTTTTFVELDH